MPTVNHFGDHFVCSTVFFMMSLQMWASIVWERRVRKGVDLPREQKTLISSSLPLL